MKYPEANHNSGDVASITPSRKVSFFDVSGLLNDNDTADPPRRTYSDAERASLVHSPSGDSGVSPTTSRKASSAFLQDVGGLLSPVTSPRPPKYSRSHTAGIELQSIPQNRASPPQQPPRFEDQSTMHSLQDVGGLLK